MEAEQEREFTIKDFGMVKENCQNNHLYNNIFPQVKRIPVSQDLAEWAARGRSGGVPQVFFNSMFLEAATVFLKKNSEAATDLFLM